MLDISKENPNAPSWFQHESGMAGRGNATSPAALGSVRVGHSEMKALIVDDDEQFRRSLFKTLSRAGYRLSVATNETEARELLMQTAFPIVIVDINTKRIGWKEFLREMISSHAEAHFIVLTPFAHDSICQELYELGIFACLTKPFKREQLLEVLTRASGSSSV